MAMKLSRIDAKYLSAKSAKHTIESMLPVHNVPVKMEDDLINREIIFAENRFLPLSTSIFNLLALTNAVSMPVKKADIKRKKMAGYRGCITVKLSKQS